MSLVYFAQTQFITNHNRLSTQHDQTHTQIIEFHALNYSIIVRNINDSLISTQITLDFMSGASNIQTHFTTLILQVCLKFKLFVI